MLKIYLVRHGQDTDNEAGLLNGHRDTELTELGLAQARELAAFIKQQGILFDKVYSSPLKRAYTTAIQITKALNLPDPEVLPLLIERDFGVMTGQKKSDIEKLCAPDIIKTETINYFLNVEGAESFPQAIIRAKELLKVIFENHKDGNILLVSHGDFGKMIYAAFYYLPWDDVLRMFHFGNSELLLLSPDTDPTKAQIFKETQFNN
jgi:Fructose-2,6-bisphosphatase